MHYYRLVYGATNGGTIGIGMNWLERLQTMGIGRYVCRRFLILFSSNNYISIRVYEFSTGLGTIHNHDSKNM